MISRILRSIKKFFVFKGDELFDEGTYDNLNPQTLDVPKQRIYTEASLLAFIKENPHSCVAYYMLAELLAENKKGAYAKKAFLLGQKMETNYHESSLNKDEKKLKKKAQIKIEKLIKESL